MPPPKVAYVPNIINLIGLIIAWGAGVLAVRDVKLITDSPWCFAIGLICLTGVVRLPPAPPPKRLIPAIVGGIKMGVILKTLFIIAGIVCFVYLFKFFVLFGHHMEFKVATVPIFGVALPLILSVIADVASIKALRAIEKAIPY